MMDDPQVWLTLSFILVVLALGKKIYKKLTWELDNRAERISRQMRELTDLYEEAKILFLKERSRAKKINKEIEKLIKSTDQLGLEMKKVNKERIRQFKADQEKIMTKKCNLVEDEFKENIINKYVKELMNGVEKQLKTAKTSKVQENFIIDQLKNLQI